jgi:hypothetical protein
LACVLILTTFTCSKKETLRITEYLMLLNF